MAIGTKLLTSVGALLLMLAALAASALYSIGSMQAELGDSAATGRRMDLAGEMATQLNMMRTSGRGMIAFSATNDSAHVSAQANSLNQQATALSRLNGEINPLLVTERGRQLLGTIEEELPRLVQAEQEMRGMCEAGKTTDAIAQLRDRAAPAADAIEKAIGDMKELQRGTFQQVSSDGTRQASIARWVTWSLMVVSLLAAGIVTRIVMSMSGQLRTAAAALDEGISQIDTASSQVASSSQSLAEGASQQAASLEETSASTEEITSMTRNNAQSSRSAAEVMTTVHNKVVEGNRALEEMMVSMQEINTSSDKIAKIIKVIDEIAFQTNILALNAAVEAARAGEAGAGFAVVADEVRNLAQRSAQASKDTAALIDESIASSRSGKTRLENVSNVIRAITSSAEEVKTLVDSVSSGSEEQTRGIEQISKAVAHMDQTTQTTAATAEEAASAAEELSAQAQTMGGAVRQLRVLVDGRAG
jgi:methyl-accepting chemotaxis protein/methyl-accepting chemotaxis protein-1 (serine sensor receptor)